MVLLLFNIDASAGQLLGKLAFLSGGKDGCVICEGDVSEEPRSRSELLPGIGLWEGSGGVAEILSGLVCFEVCCPEGHRVRPSRKLCRSWVLVSLTCG